MDDSFSEKELLSNFIFISTEPLHDSKEGKKKRVFKPISLNQAWNE
jgi:hypothetical protein